MMLGLIHQCLLAKDFRSNQQVPVLLP
jgi:hypothetical protein